MQRTGMRQPARTTAKPPDASSPPLAEAAEIGSALARTLRKAFGGVEGEAARPSRRAEELGVSRVLLSRTLTAIAAKSPLGTIHRLPGPETLRGLVEAARAHGLAAPRARAALREIDRFARLIRDSFGTRGALNAAVCSHGPALTRRHEHEARYRVFKGMRELRGVEAETWLSASIIVPDPNDPAKLAVTMLQGFLALRRLRLDVPVVVAFESLGGAGGARGHPVDMAKSVLALREFYENQPAPLVVERHGDQFIYRLDSDHVGKDAVTDMLAVVRLPSWRSRYLVRERPRTGPFAQPPAPVKLLHFDVISAPGVIVDGSPELFAYAPSVRGSANPNDRARDFDRMSVPEVPECVEGGLERFDVAEIPHYGSMLARLAREAGYPLESMRLQRVRIPYPMFGAQFVNTFCLPEDPRPSA